MCENSWFQKKRNEKRNKPDAAKAKRASEKKNLFAFFGTAEREEEKNTKKSATIYDSCIQNEAKEAQAKTSRLSHSIVRGQQQQQQQE
jgi:hypothetical protein